VLGRARSCSVEEGALRLRCSGQARHEAGICVRTGRIYLGAYASGLAATASTFYDDDVTRFVAPGTGKSPLLAAAVGYPAT
jgi:hypothetical protein